MVVRKSSSGEGRNLEVSSSQGLYKCPAVGLPPYLYVLLHQFTLIAALQWKKWRGLSVQQLLLKIVPNFPKFVRTCLELARQAMGLCDFQLNLPPTCSLAPL